MGKTEKHYTEINSKNTFFLDSFFDSLCACATKISAVNRISLVALILDFILETIEGKDERNDKERLFQGGKLRVRGMI
jgi:hypothetical protein